MVARASLIGMTDFLALIILDPKSAQRIDVAKAINGGAPLQVDTHISMVGAKCRGAPFFFAD
jgi:hypothetical protein